MFSVSRLLHALQALLLILASFTAISGSTNVQYRPGECLKGDKHRELPCPQPEGPDYEACFQWRDSTCCTAEFTSQLAVANGTNIDGFHWSRCDPPLSQRCENYFQRVECFYRCSTNVAHWALPQFDSALAGLPVCGDFCEDWFDACAEDFTCATNWVTDWDFIEGINQCKPNSTCRNFSTIYENGTGLCNTLWGGSFVYTSQSPTDPQRTCLSFYWPENETNPNDVPIRNIFGRQVDTVTPPPCNGGHRVIPNLATGAALMLVATIFRWAY